jgi:hypothetical protein
MLLGNIQACRNNAGGVIQKHPLLPQGIDNTPQRHEGGIHFLPREYHTFLSKKKIASTSPQRLQKKKREGEERDL